MAGDEETAEREEAATAALATITSSLGRDGYRLHLSQTDRADCYNISIEALPDACEDCLVPKDMMSSMISVTLERSGIEVSGINLRYPPASVHETAMSNLGEAAERTSD